MNDREIEFLKAVCEVVSEKMATRDEQHAAEIAALKSTIATVSAELAELKAQPLPEAPQLPDIEGLVKAAVAEIPAPKDGQSVTVEDVRPLIEEAAAEAVKALPVPEAPQLPDIEGLVKAAVAEIPAPKDGQSVTVEDVRPLIEEAAAEAVKALPLPEAPQLPDIEGLVKAAVAEIPAPKDGQSVTVEDVRPLIEEAAAEAVKALPLPEAPQLPDIEGMVKAAAAEIQIPQPRNGEDGRDALQLEILPFIDEAKSYPRGTYATHNGGLWRAYEKTYGFRGWECVVDGVSEINVTNSSEREFTVTVQRASGAAEQKAFALPVVLYRGVFKAGEAYAPGDAVTWGGSLWHCNEATSDKPGENGSKGWQLAVKRGRDGRDAK